MGHAIAIAGVAGSLRRHAPGLALLAGLAAVAMLAASQATLRAWGLSPLVLALLVGAALGHARPALVQGRCQPGLRWAQRTLLRTGVALYGFHLSVAQAVEAGRSGWLIDLAVLVSTLALGVFVGTRWLRMDRASALLVSAGSAICGAAAIVATASMLALDERERVARTTAAVATISLFGTAALLLYPLLFAWLGPDPGRFGVFIGSTVHEVAQVVALGDLIGGDAARHAIVAKMLRVLMLVPFLLALGWWMKRRAQISSAPPASSLGDDPQAAGSRGEASRPDAGCGADGQPGLRVATAPTPAVPWFALVFVLFVVLNSVVDLPPSLRTLLQQTGTLCLVFAMAAFGLETTWATMRRAGLRPVLLGAVLFVHLVGFGALLNVVIGG